MAALPTCFGSTDLVLARACDAQVQNGFRLVEAFDEKLALDEELADEETARGAPLPGSGPYLRDRVRILLPYMDVLFGRVLPDSCNKPAVSAAAPTTSGQLTLFDRLPFEPRVNILMCTLILVCNTLCIRSTWIIRVT